MNPGEHVWFGALILGLPARQVLTRYSSGASFDQGSSP